MKILRASENDRHAAEDVSVPGFEGVKYPKEFLNAKTQRLRPVFILPSDTSEIVKMFRFMSEILLVRIYLYGFSCMDLLVRIYLYAFICKDLLVRIY